MSANSNPNPFLKVIGKSKLLGGEISIGVGEVMMDLFFPEYTLKIRVLGPSLWFYYL